MFLKTTSDLLNSSTTNGTYLGTASISNENGVTVHPILKFTHFVHLKMIFDLLCQMLQHIYIGVKKFSGMRPSLISRNLIADLRLRVSLLPGQVVTPVIRIE